MTNTHTQLTFTEGRHPDIVMLNLCASETGRCLSNLTYDHINLLSTDLDFQAVEPTDAEIENLLNGGSHLLSVYSDFITRMDAANLSTSNLNKARNRWRLMMERINRFHSGLRT
jgi:hypothetical protein